MMILQQSQWVLPQQIKEAKIPQKIEDAYANG
jgi:hypothetical protein